TATFTVVAQIDASATGNLVNTVTVSPPSGTSDPDTTNNSATDTDTASPQVDVAVTKVDNKGGSSSGSVGTVVPGSSFTYTITVSNSGPSTATNVGVSDTFPAGISADSWSGTD